MDYLGGYCCCCYCCCSSLVVVKNETVVKVVVVAENNRNIVVVGDYRMGMDCRSWETRSEPTLFEEVVGNGCCCYCCFQLD